VTPDIRFIADFSSAFDQSEKSRMLDAFLSIEKNTLFYPWNAEQFNICFKLGAVAWILEHRVDRQIMGFVLMMDSIDHIDLLHITVDKPYQQQGYGQQLLTCVLNYAHVHHKNIFLEVRKSNVAAIALYEKNDFCTIGQRKKYYATHEDREDALVMQYRIVE